MADPSRPEMLLLALILLASIVASWRRFRPILKAILGSKKDADFRLRPLGPRIRDLLWEVALQAKVIRQRPWPGLAHAVVFWGFCAFALATVDHVARGFGLRLIPHGGAGGLYLWLVAVFALAVAVAIGGLGIRRFLVRPKWLGEVSVESFWIAFLIFMLMWTYLAGYVMPEAGTLSRAVWWIHTLSLAVFLPLIPNTKHLHLALSPVTVFLGRGGFSRIPPLQGDEDFGLSTGKDVTRLTALQAYSCVECGRCTEHCPAYNTGKELDPKRIVLGVRGYLNEHGPAGELPLLEKHISQEAAFQCTTCGACEYQCPVGIEHLPVIVGLRRGAVNTGKWEDDHGNRLFLNLERHGNPLGLPAQEREKFIENTGFPLYDGSQEYCLWLGCMGAYDPQGREIVAVLARLMDYLGIRFGVLPKEKCTGDAARRLGNDLAFEELARDNLNQLAQRRVKRLVSICPHCVRTIAEDWREYGEAPPVEHHSELLARHAAKLPGGDATMTVFHDPCYLGRYRRVYDEPRKVAAKAGRLIEAERSRERSFCCGAGGGLVFLGEEKGKRVSVERTEQLAATGAKLIGVACPFCHSMFRDALSALPAAPQLLDIAQIAAASLPSETPQERH